MPPHPSAPIPYRPDVDGLRALAVCAVIAFHSTPTLVPGGYLGVDIFFVISGYLITGVILAEMRSGAFDLATFYLRRMRRILPALLTMLFGIVPLALLVLMPDELQRFARTLVASAAFVPNFLLYFEHGYFDAEAQTKPLLHLWSLGVEEQFYLVWPALLLVCLRRVREPLVFGFIVAAGVFSFLLHLWAADRSATLDFYMPMTRMWELLIGAALAAAASRPDFVARSARVSDGAAVVGVTLMIASCVFARPTQAVVASSLISTMGAAIFIAAGPGAFLNRVVFAWRPVVYVGLISYPLYLWNWPFMSFVHVLHVQGVAANRLLRVFVLVLGIVAAVLTYHWIELPVRRRRDLRALGLRLGGLLLVVATVGVVIVAFDGFPQRAAVRTDPLVWPAALRTQSRCLDEYFPAFNSSDGPFCMRTHYEAPPEIVLLGDSNANALLPGVRTAFPQRSVLQIGASSCPYLRDADNYSRNRGERRSTCPPLMEVAYGAIGPATRVVILAAADETYLADPGGIRSVHDPAMPTAEFYERALTRELGYLLGNDREVVLVLAVPVLDFAPESCLRTRPVDRWLPVRDPAACAMPRQLVEERQALYRAIVARVARALGNDHLHVVDSLDALCDAQVCNTIIDGESMYRDPHHLSIQGSLYVWSRIQPDVLRRR